MSRLGSSSHFPPPPSTLENLYDELVAMAIIRALPHSFDDVVWTILVLDKFDKPSVIQVLWNMDQTCANLSSTSAFSASSAPPRASSWNADIGTLAHVTFNRHWMCNLTPNHILIHLADGSVIYSERIGTVQFSPVVHWSGNGASGVHKCAVGRHPQSEL